MNDTEWQPLMDQFEVYLRADKGLASLTVRNYLTDIQPLYEYAQINKLHELKTLGRYVLRGYLAWLVDLGYARSSIVRKLSTLRTFLKWLIRENLIDDLHRSAAADYLGSHG